MDIPPSLVLGCNTPHGLGVLSDWIQEHTGVAPDFTSTSWSDDYGVNYNFGSGDGYAHDVGDGAGAGGFYGYASHCNGYGDGNGYGYGGSGDGRGAGNGLGHGFWLSPGFNRGAA